MAVSPVAPISPDFYVCDRTFYGEPYLQDCLNAASLLPIGSEPLTFAVNGHGGHDLPRIMRGNCEIMVDIGSQNYAIDHLVLRPNLLRNMAGWLLKQCVAGSHMGGFVTMGLEETIDYLADPSTNFQSDFPIDAAFVTVDISIPLAEDPQPGDYDPAVAEHLANALHSHRKAAPAGSVLQTHCAEGETLLAAQALVMSRGGREPWWGYVPLAQQVNTMLYECDNNLGRPNAMDCAQLEYSQIGTEPASTIEIKPGIVEFLHLNTCNVAISSDIPIALTWAQIKIALDALINLCVLELPLKGGRARYRSQSPLDLGGLRALKRAGNVTGLNALPPHVNLTLYRQFEPYPSNTATQLSTCTWQHVISGQDVRACQNMRDRPFLTDLRTPVNGTA